MRTFLAAVCVLSITSCKEAGDDDPSDTPTNRRTCSSDAACDGDTCCGGECHDVALSNQHCGSCGTTCNAAQYCAPEGCSGLTFATLCDNAAAKKIYDGNAVDQDAADRIAAAYVSACAPSSVAVSSVSAANAVAANGGPNGGRGVTFIVAGGGVYQDVAKYMADEGLAPIKVTSDGYNFQIKRANGQSIVADNFGSVDPSHMSYQGKDYFVIHAAYDPMSGTLVLSAYGIYPMGTQMGAWYFENVLAASASAFAQRWLVGEWQDADDDGNPQAAEFSVLASE